MSKPYSNKALPPGTILREWRLEDVLGVGGFGIVYKGRGIYFGELVAIKEYFPSSISERDAEDTVVPLGSDVEEVHALGLKKFVEEAKLLWNLSTPTRHPNIVSVRSLFEVHGTAYMVMDFEDGVSLSKMLKQGRRFNERSLWDIIKPIAEGLERAHRVGVLHRDIKPPNILINQDGRPVLIDFGSARFEAAEATSTKVTFHTPPYAAIEQYVKTYEQGPWTDIYALGVVLYECVTGEKPPEVLERMHGGLGQSLADGKWPGYSKQFLAAIDAAMTIKPSERPQSISEWLALFEEGRGRARAGTHVAIDDEATRFVAYDAAVEEILPVAPPVEASEPIDTRVPDDPKEVEFKRAGAETGAKKKIKSVTAAAAAAGAASAADTPNEEGQRAKGGAGGSKAAAANDTGPAKKRAVSPMLAGAAAVALLAVVGGGWAMFGRGGSGATEAARSAPAAEVDPAVAAIDMSDVGTLVPALRGLADRARTSGAPAGAVSVLTAAGDDVAARVEALQAMASTPARAGEAAGLSDEIKRRAAAANVEFANALLRDAEGRSRKLAADVPWANPGSANAARAESSDRQAAAARLRTSLAQLRNTVGRLGQTPDVATAFEVAGQAIAHEQGFRSAAAAVYTREAERRRTKAEGEADSGTATVATATAPAASKAAPTKAPLSSDTELSPEKARQFDSIVSEGRSMARQVIRLGERGSGAGAQQRRANAALARNYDSHLVKLKDSFRGAASDRQADSLIQQARQTRAYLQFLLKQSSGTP